MFLFRYHIQTFPFYFINVRIIFETNTEDEVNSDSLSNYNVKTLVMVTWMVFMGVILI